MATAKLGKLWQRDMTLGWGSATRYGAVDSRGDKTICAQWGNKGDLIFCSLRICRMLPDFCMKRRLR